MSNEPNDKRSVATDALATLGTIIDASQKRDAIHLAVEPVIAGQMLSAGDHITVKDGVATVAVRGKGLGIVDPFLLNNVKKGERFWFVMYPRMIHSLRHVWAHPAFADEPGTPSPVSADERAIAESWLRQYAARVNSHYDADEAYDTLMSDIRGKTLTYHGTDMHSRGDLEDADELRKYASVVLGYSVNWDDFDYFSCTC